MPRDGSGNVTISQYPVTAFTLTDAATQNAAIEDIRQMIEGSIPVSGVKAASADLPMGGFKHTGVGNAAARNQYAAVGQLQDGSLTFGGSVGGTGDATTLSLTPAITAYVGGQRISYLAPGSNSSTAPTLNVNGLGAKTIKRAAGAALSASDIVTAQLTMVEYDGASFILLNPSADVGTSGFFSATATGVSGGGSKTVYYAKSGSMVTLSFQASSDTSSATSFTYTGLPAALQPTRNQYLAVPDGCLLDNGALLLASSASAGSAAVIGSVITFSKNGAPSGWTGTGSKGFGNSFSVSYLLN